MKLLVFKLLSICTSIWITSINFVRTVHDVKIPAMNFIVMALALTSLIYLFKMRQDE